MRGIHETIPEAEVRLEFKPRPDERVYLDIWVPKIRIALELKCLKSELVADWSGESFALLHGGARDFGRYDFLKDVQGLERLAKVGFAICLTNDSKYWEAPKRKTNDAAFRLHEGQELEGELKWSKRAGAGKTKGREAPINLRNQYKMMWRDFSEVGGGRFRYLALEVHGRGLESVSYS